jgi:hypothetical protein
LQREITALKHALERLIEWWMIQNLYFQEAIDSLKRSEDPRVQPPPKVIVT